MDFEGILGRVMDLTTGKMKAQTQAMKAQSQAAIDVARAQLMVAKVQAQVRAAEARSGVQSLQNSRLRFNAESNLPENVRRNRRAAGLPENTTQSFSYGVDQNMAALSRGVLSGTLSPGDALKQLEKLQATGKLTASAFAEAAQNVANMNAELENAKAAQQGLDALDGKGLGILVEPGKDKKTKDRKAKDGKSQSEIDRAFNDEARSLMQQYNSARGSMAKSAQEAAEFELRNVEIARISALEAVKFNADYSAAQKQQLSEQIDQIAEEERARVEREKSSRLEQEAEQAKQEQVRAQMERLQTQMSLADTDAERLRLALEMFDLDRREKQAALERIIASETRTQAEKDLAQAALDNLKANAPAARQQVARQNETAVQAYLRDLNKSPEDINQAIDQIKINGLERLNDELVDALINFKSLGDVAKNVLKSVLAELLRLQIQQAIIKPLAGALGLKIPGYANGTNFAPGGLAIVGEEGPELINLRRGSQVISNQELKGLAANSNTSVNVFVDGGMNDRQARATGQQVGRAAVRTMNGPVRGV